MACQDRKERDDDLVADRAFPDSNISVNVIWTHHTCNVLQLSGTLCVKDLRLCSYTMKGGDNFISSMTTGP